MSPKFGQTDLIRLANIVREETGNEVSERNHSMLESRIRSRMMSLKLESLEDYWDHFKKNESSEREVLKGLLTTHHTFFFREFVHFEAVETWLETQAQALKSSGSNRKLQVWSAACSRGQEAYSLAMHLNDVALKRHGIDFQIFATDIDPESVAYARNAVYPLSEVNSIPHNFLAEHWKRGSGQVKDFAKIKDDLKAKVNFETLNLLSISQYPQRQFDLIFCRNVFIYFSPENVAKIATALSGKLHPRGLFVSGVSEPLHFKNWNFISIAPSCYQRPEATANPERREKREPRDSGVTQRTRPTVLSATPTQTAAFSYPSPTPSVASPYRVLCVDDSPTIQKLITKIFSQDPNCKGVDIANHGGEARDLLNRSTYQLITLDIHMPVVNGIEFLEKHYKRKVDPPVIMISSVNRSDIELATKSIRLGAFDYVEKPSMNQLEKSAGEILVKAKMAMRSGPETLTSQRNLDFDQSLAKKIVVPDASQCLRVIVSDMESVPDVFEIIRGQDHELRSPPTVVVYFGDEERIRLERHFVETSSRPVQSLKVSQILKPMVVYLVESQDMSQLFATIDQRMVSVQWLASKKIELPASLRSVQAQFLLDEKQQAQQSLLEAGLKLKFDDISPSTSFASLSLEFFAGVRKATAA